MDTFIKPLLFTGDYLMVNINQVIFAQIGIETYLNHKNICNISIWANLCKSYSLDLSLECILKSDLFW